MRVRVFVASYGWITFYSWRRKFASQIDRLASRDRARQEMGHDSMCHVYVEYYDEGAYDLDTVGLLIDRDGGASRAEATENQVSLGLHRAVHVKNCEKRNLAVEKFVNNHLEIKKFQLENDHDKLQATKKRLRSVIRGARDPIPNKNYRLTKAENNRYGSPGED